MRPLVLALLLASAVASTALADRDRDHDRARAAVRAGQIVPLAEILAVVERDFPGEVIEVELESERLRGRRVWIYEIKLLGVRGNVLELEYDARTKRLLRVKGRRIDGGRKRGRRR